MSQHGLVIEVPAVTEVPPPSAPGGREDLGAGMKRIAGAILDEVLDNTDRKVGVGLIGRLLNWDQRTSQIDDNVREQIDRIANNEHRLLLKAALQCCLLKCMSLSTVGHSGHIVGCSG